MLRALIGLCLVLGFAEFASAKDYFILPTVVFKPLQLQSLARITNDRTSDVQELFAILEDSGIVSGIQFVTHHSDGTDATKSFTMDQIAAGAVLNTDSSRDVFILKGKVDGDGAVADLTVRYLSNGLTGSYKECSVSLLRSSQGTWGLYNATSSVLINSIVITTWSLGIDKVENVCD